MYLKSLKIGNFRKFGNKNNIVEFVDSKESLATASDVNVAKATSLVVGKNNAGKTTIITALDKIVNNQKFNANDFNFIYLNRLLNMYKKNHYMLKANLYFELIIGIDERNHDDLVNNFVPFMQLGDSQAGVEKKDFTIVVKYELKNDEEFVTAVKDLIMQYSQNENILFNKFLSLFNMTELFEFNYYNSNSTPITTNFNIKKLIDIQIIKPNENQGEKDLSKIFSQIIKYKYEQEGNPNRSTFQTKIELFNDDMSKDIENEFTNGLNSVIGKLHDKNTLQVYLNSNLEFDELLDKLVRYQYKENGLHIPENQFGLGYRNLMRIIGELIDYVEKYPDGDKHSKLNLICIEEPEVFMHPQMQELFINHIKEAINTLLGSSAKRLNSQLIVSTHSAHILNSKIHTSNSFDNINYVYEKNNLSQVVNLKDSEMISSEKNTNETDEEKEKRTKEELNFIKKHIKFKASELFFADAIIFVEGITEEVILSYYISIDKQLNKKYITIFNINGAHGLVYHHLIKLLDVPTLVITDLDIKRTEQEKKDFIQIDNLQTRTTTNNTIIKYNLTNNITSLTTSHFKNNNLYIAFQGDKIKDFYATSLEESLILSNYNNDILNTTIKKVKPEIYKEILTDSNERENLIQNSYKLQRKLSSSKSDFANELLYQLSINEDETKLPKLPNYIEDALKWLKTELGFTQDEE
ncbi:AAA family ATPase [Aliarcobacter butzleri]|uniref:AAA family ATPase n=1 Tax=Aliarcobacter butzleri TaxID=28197 RepID=UPI001EDADBE4|nr:AAA family ATPase [Aliarcobacter butzleri]MCG3664438.1 AAA family ATPase [Aliarcobacter butzleri]